MTREQYLSTRGFNGSNEGGPEVTSKLHGYEVTDANGFKSWMSETLFNDIQYAMDPDKVETPVEEVKVVKIFNVYNETRRDEINAKSEADKPEFIRVTGEGFLIPDDYMPMEKQFTSEDNTVYETLYRLIKTTE
jgi:hypothetical protein